jgi:uridine monophosphate synthetase
MTGTAGFFAKLQAAVERNNSLLCVGLDPQPDQLPAAFQRRDRSITEAILDWNLAVIGATQHLVCAYKPNIAFYEALGRPGLDLLRATLDAIPDGIPTILDAKRGDIGSTATAYAKAIFDEWRVDAVTLSPYLGRDSLEPFFRYADKGLFVLCHTSNPGAGDLQELDIDNRRSGSGAANQPLFVHVARSAPGWSPNVGLVVGATFPAALRSVRTAAPGTWFLVPGIGAQGGDLEATVAAGIRADGSGILVNASRGVALAEDPEAAARTLRDAINTARHAAQAQQASTPSPAQPPRDHRLVEGLTDLQAIKFGDFTLASGAQSPFYIDLRLLVSDPALLAEAAAGYAAILANLDCDRIAGVPYAALPIATAVSLQTGVPLVYLRKEAKTHGLGKDIEGAFQPGEKVVIVEDLITSGGSTIQNAERLRAAGLIVEHVIVLIDREQGGAANLAKAGITAHAVFTLTTILDQLEQSGRLAVERSAEVRAFVQGHQLA